MRPAVLETPGGVARGLRGPAFRAMVALGRPRARAMAVTGVGAVTAARVWWRHDAG